MDKKPLLAWSLYDFANSAFLAVMQTFLLPAYFVREVFQDQVRGATLWGMTLGGIGILLALTGPILGTLSDQQGGKKRALALFASLVVIASSLLFFVKPDPLYIPMTLVLFGLGVIGAECAFIFYNSMLADIAKSNEIGKWSGYGWGLGYFGGMIVLILCSILTNRSLNLLSHEEGFDIRCCFLMVAGWFTLFSIPLFLYVPSTEKKVEQPISLTLALQKLYRFFFVEKEKNLLYFFIARMFFIDGLITLFAFGGIYAAAIHQFTEAEVLLYGVGLNVFAGVGSILLGRLDDRIGPYFLITFSLIALMTTGIGILITTSPLSFTILSLILGFFIGPVQSSSRSFLAKIAPPDRRGELFGLFSLSGKATSFMGPFLVSFSIASFNSLKGGMGAILCFFAIGLLLLQKVTLRKLPVKENAD